MIPLNIHLQEAFEVLRKVPEDAKALEQIEKAVIEYGDAIKELVAANIFPGDMLWKNFGITRHGKIVFYDYDEIEYITDCEFRYVPPPQSTADDAATEPAQTVQPQQRFGPRDVFPEMFAPCLLGNHKVRDLFMKHHADLLEVPFWQTHKERIQAGYVHDVFPYERQRRFVHQRR